MQHVHEKGLLRGYQSDFVWTMMQNGHGTVGLYGGLIEQLQNGNKKTSLHGGIAEITRNGQEISRLRGGIRTHLSDYQ